MKNFYPDFGVKPLFKSINPKKYIFFYAIAMCLCLCAQRISRRTPVVEVVEKVGPAIVNINTERLVRTSVFNDPFYDEYYGTFRPRYRKARNLGSGVIIDPYGFIITNAHVVQRASKITVTLSNKKNFQGKLIAINERNDIALLKIDSPTILSYVLWGNSEDIMIGETAIALGNPFWIEK